MLAIVLFGIAATERERGAAEFNACRDGFFCMFTGFLYGVEYYAGALASLLAAGALGVTSAVAWWRQRGDAAIPADAPPSNIEDEIAQIDDELAKLER